jgi:hypothetical protein
MLYLDALQQLSFDRRQRLRDRRHWRHEGTTVRTWSS